MANIVVTPPESTAKGNGPTVYPNGPSRQESAARPIGEEEIPSATGLGKGGKKGKGQGKEWQVGKGERKEVVLGNSQQDMAGGKRGDM